MAIDAYVQQTLKQLREKNSLTLEQLAQKLETTPITLSRYENGKRSVSLCILEEICKIYQLTIEDFFNNPFALTNSTDEITSSTMLPQSQEIANKHSVFVYGEIAAGYFSDIQQDYIAEIEIPEKISKRYGASNLFGLAVNGESMNKIVQDSDYVLINKQSDARNGDIVAVMYNNETSTLKRFYQLDAETIILKPESNDSSFQPITIDLRQPDTDFTILGKMVWYCAPY
jgi:SOS-response transcriptional repressors (RecA-mediated autopeptidases)